MQKEYTVDFLTKKSRKNNGELPQYFVPNHHEGIVSHEVFNAVQTEIVNRGEQITKFSGKNVITRKLKCGDCGGTMCRKLYHSTDKFRYFGYRCYNRYQGSRDCHNRNIREDVVKSEFVKAVNEMLKKKKYVIEELKHMVSLLDNNKLIQDCHLRNKNSKKWATRLIGL